MKVFDRAFTLFHCDLENGKEFISSSFEQLILEIGGCISVQMGCAFTLVLSPTSCFNTIAELQTHPSTAHP